MRILVIEDSNDLGFLLKEALSDDYVIDLAENLKTAYNAIDTEDYDLLILDLFFSDGNGLDFCIKIRKEGNETPILFLTGDISLESKVKSLDAGGDDYLTKPFNLSELKARIKVLLRRKKTVFSKESNFRNLKINHQTREVLKNGKTVQLTRKEFMLLELFIKNPKKIFSKERIAASIWENTEVLYSNSIESHIAVIRRKIDRKLIKTIRGMGYCLADI